MTRPSLVGLAFLVSLLLPSAAFARGGGHSYGGSRSYSSHSYRSYSGSSGSYSGGQVHVRGYTKKNGTYVAPHMRTAPNHTQRDNWSENGNVNPYTGKVGTKEPER